MFLKVLLWFHKMFINKRDIRSGQFVRLLQAHTRVLSKCSNVDDRTGDLFLSSKFADKKAYYT